MATKNPYYVSFKVNNRLGVTKGRKTFKSFSEAQKFAVRVNNQKSAELLSWGTNRAKR